MAAELVEGQLHQADPADGHRPGPGRVDPGEQPAEGRLAGAAGADHGQPLPWAQVEVDPVEHVPAGGVGEADVPGDQLLADRPAAGDLPVGRHVGDPEQAGEGGRADLEVVEPGQDHVQGIDELAHVEGDGRDLRRWPARGRGAGRRPAPRSPPGSGRSPRSPGTTPSAGTGCRRSARYCSRMSSSVRRTRRSPAQRLDGAAALDGLGDAAGQLRPGGHLAGSRPGRGAGTSGSPPIAAAPRPGPTAA